MKTSRFARRTKWLISLVVSSGFGTIVELLTFLPGPLSWLHFFVPLLSLALWLGFGFIIHELISDRLMS